MITLVIVLLTTTNPLLVAVTTVLQSIVLGWVSWFWIKDSWPVLLFIIVYFGGVLILFLYVCSLTQRVKMFIKMPIALCVLPVGAVLDLSLVGLTTFSTDRGSTLLTHQLGLRGAPLIGFLIIYLLVALIIAVKSSRFYKGALRQI